MHSLNKKGEINMKFVFVTDNDRLKPVVERVRNEGYYAEMNPRGVTKAADVVITDKPVDTHKANFCVGNSKFSESLLNPSYHDAMLVMNDIMKGDTPPNTYISCWFNGVDFVFPAVVSVNENRFVEGDRGAEVNSMGCTLRVCSPKKAAFIETLYKFKDLLRKVSYCGFFTLECSFKNDSIKVVKIEPYFKYDLMYAFLEGTQGELGRTLHDIAIGGKKEFKFPEMFAIAVRISIPPYPYSHVKSKKVELKGICPENEKHIWLQNTIRSKYGLVVSNGSYGVIATVTARGCSVRECRKRVYRTLENLSIEEMQYRKDVGINAEATFENMKKGKWL